MSGRCLLRAVRALRSGGGPERASRVPRDKSTAGDTGGATIYITLAIGYHVEIAESSCFIVPTY